MKLPAKALKTIKKYCEKTQCRRCPYGEEYENYVDVYRKDADDRFEGRYYLKPLPKKKNTDFHPNIVYANGWNDCLEEIQK